MDGKLIGLKDMACDMEWRVEEIGTVGSSLSMKFLKIKVQKMYKLDKTEADSTLPRKFGLVALTVKSNDWQYRLYYY